MDSVSLLQFFGSFALVCAMILGMAGLVKKTGLAKHLQRTKSASGSLAVEDVLFLDPRHRCLVVRWHDESHLILLAVGQPPQVIAHRPATHTPPATETST